jgi:hypothetical protein
MTERHDCTERINALLAPKNTILAVAFSIDSARELVMLTTVKADTKKRGKPATLFASFCPFCGRKLATE